MNQKIYDILVIGGGINGTGIACDAAGRGLSVALCEQNDLASGTSSASTKLVHGGLRYLEHGEFRLVHEALNEREVLMAKAPHLISPLTFILPYQKQLRPRWLLRIGLWIYDHLGHRITLPKSHAISFQETSFGEPLKASLKDGFMFSDCWADDARLVVENAMAARAHGAAIFTYCTAQQFHVDNGIWHVSVHDNLTQQSNTLYAKALVNATGPWVKGKHIRLVKGSHLIVKQTYQGSHAYLIQHTDGRVIFVIPYQQHFTLIGTTDVVYHGDPSVATLDDMERDYLLNAYNTYFKKTLNEKDIISHYSGVRPLVDDGTQKLSKITREYVLTLDTQSQAPLLSVLGGKITTYRTLAENTLEKLLPFFPKMGSAWTKTALLPGGDIPEKSLLTYIQRLHSQFLFLSDAEISRLVHLYGTCTEKILAGCTNKKDLGEYFGEGCYEKELQYAIKEEWVKKPEDFLCRRTKLYLTLSAEERKKVVAWFERNAL